MGRTTLFLDDHSIFSSHGRLDPWSWAWAKADIPQTAQAICDREAIRSVFASNGNGKPARRLPVGVIGPRDASPEQLEAAEAIGAQIGELGLTMICGGKTGVMTAAAKGCHEVGGLAVGLIPDHDWREANPYIALPIATGLSEARNMIIAKSCEVLIAVGGSYGTLSEIAYGLHFGKPVIGLEGAPAVDGLESASGPDDAINKLARHLIERVKAS